MSVLPHATPVNAPHPIRVSTDVQGRPVMVQIKSRQWRVQEVRDHWVTEAAPSPPPRSYFLLRLEGGPLCCVFLPTGEAKWYRQRISQRAWARRTPQPGD